MPSTCGYSSSMRSLLSTLLLIFMASAPSKTAKAQHCGSSAQSSIGTDRPQVTNSSVVIPCGTVQFENGFQETSTGAQRSFDFSETSIRFGIGSRTELRLSIPNYFNSYLIGTRSVNGFGDLTLGSKQQLGPILHHFDGSLIPSLTFPTGTESISSHGYDPSLQLPWSRPLSKNWMAAGMFSVSWPTVSDHRNLTGQSSFYIDRQLLPPLDAYVEYSGAFPQKGGPQHLVDAGLAFKPSPHQQIDFHGGFGLSASVPDHIIGLGYSFRFPVTPARFNVATSR